jgi:(S)-mandelate dehydrogenase
MCTIVCRIGTLLRRQPALALAGTARAGAGFSGYQVALLGIATVALLEQVRELPRVVRDNLPAVAQPLSSALQRQSQRPAVLAWAALGLAAGALALARSRHKPVPTPAPGAISPARLGDTPQRRFYTGSNLARAVSVEDLRAMAHRRLPRFVLEYLEGGAEEEATLARNRAVLGEFYFKHRSLVDVSRRDVSSVLFERPMPMPVAVAPTGFNGLFWPHADLRLAEAAAAAGVPFAQSTMSNDTMERISRVPGLRHWWQLYVFGTEEVRNNLIDRARDCGCEALIVTTDAQIFGNRTWEMRDQSGPEDLSWPSRFDVLAHPDWLGRGILTHGMPSFANVVQFVPRGQRGLLHSAHWIRGQMDRALTWDKVARIRDRWPRKLIVKGLLTVEDAVHAATIGADAVALSNHGGRQLDWAVSPLDILPEVRRALGDRVAILADGGMRHGTDVIKALMLGADAVFAGRAVLYGVAAAGRAGAKRALDILHQELQRDFGLLGVGSVAELDSSLLVRSPSTDCGPAALNHWAH